MPVQMSRLVVILWLGVIIALAAYALLTLWFCLAGLAYPYQLDYGEGMMLAQARMLAQGQAIYKQAAGFPYFFANYPPVMFALAAGLVRLLGTSFLAGRIIAVPATLLLAALCGWLVWQTTRHRLAAVIAGLAFLGSPYVYHWAPLFRVDLLGLLFSVAGLYVLWRANKPQRPFTDYSLYLATILFLLGLYTKQSFLAAPLAALLWLLFRDWRRALLLAGLLLLLGLPPFLLLNQATQGGFAFGLLSANVNPFSARLLLGQVADFLRTFAVLFLLAVYAWLDRLRHPSPGRGGAGGEVAFLARLSVLDFYFVTALATIALAGKVGAWQNYFFEPLLVLCVFAGLAIARVQADSRWQMADGRWRIDSKGQIPLSIGYRLSAIGYQRAVAILIPALLLVQAILMWHTPTAARQLMADNRQAYERLSPLIRAQTGLILSEDLGLLVLNGQEVPYYSFEYAQLARTGRWDQQWELAALRQQHFSLVVLERGTRENPDRYQRFTREVLSEVDRSYALAEEVARYRVYRPSPLQRERNVGFGDALALLGNSVERPAGAGLILSPGQAITVTLLWQAKQPVGEDYTVFVHLLDRAGRRWAQHDAQPLGNLYPTSRWATGEMVRDSHPLNLPADLPPGRYFLQVGLYRPATGARLPVSTGGDSLLLATLLVGQPDEAPSRLTSRNGGRDGASEVQPEDMRQPVHASLGGQAELVGYALSPAAVRPGETLRLTLFWQARQWIAQDYTVFVHLLDSQGKLWAQHDGPPQDGALPTSAWNPGELLRDEHLLTVDIQAPPGDYRLAIGLYDPATLQRLPVFDAQGRLVGDTVLLEQAIRKSGN
ncbi:MAG: glycosyltransferase family 39 protein [Chloroflexi bacterium]|nr:glycosyltransferase family 39 protein [Chloroflexota bacterium]